MLWVSVFLISVAAGMVGIGFFHLYYTKATLEAALVRTGLGGKRVVLDGGCMVLPIIHRVQKVAMGAMVFRITRSGREAFLSSDKLRVDITIEFEFRVGSTPEDVTAAAQILGNRIARGASAIGEIVTGPMIDATQTIAATYTLADLHQARSAFTEDIAKKIAEAVKPFGLVLVTASLVGIDQSDLSSMDDRNAFDAEGLRRLAEIVAGQRKARAQVEAETEIAVRESHLARHQRQLDIERAEREASISQQEHLIRLEAEAKSVSARKEAEADLAAESAKIEKNQQIQTLQITNDEVLRRAEMAAILALEEVKIENEMQLAQRRAKESEIKAAEERARAQMLLAAEDVQSQKEQAIAKREYEVAQLKLNKDLRLASERAGSESEIMRLRADAKAQVTKISAEAEQLRIEAEAAGRAAQIAADNALSEQIISMRLEERRLDRLPEIMTQMMKPVEKIESIRINQIGGIGGSGATSESAGGGETAFGAAMDQILGMAVRLPAMKQMGAEIGLDFDSHLAGRTADYANRIKPKSEDGKP